MHSKKKQTASRGNGLFFLMDFLLTIVPALIFFYTYAHYYPEATFYSKGYYLFFVVYWAILILFMSIYGACKVRKYRTRELTFAFALSSFFADVIMYFVMCMIAMKMLSPWLVLLAMVVQWAAEIVLYVAFRIATDRLEPRKTAIFISDREEDDIGDKFDPRRTNYELTGHLSASLPAEELAEAAHRCDTVIFGDMDVALRGRLMDYCFRNGISVMVKPNMRDIMMGCSETVVLSDLMLFGLHTGTPDRGYLAVKRLIDIAASLLGLIICSPILIGTAIAIKSQDGGPVFFRQKRLTKDGKPFMLTKFRSMVVNAESATGAVLAGERDPRITKVGAFIRATRIDELPQLLNILNGEMTLVGPRPERPEFYEKYCAEYPEFAYRLQTRAGLTGYAQLYGKYNTSFEDKARMDMYYIQKASLLLDIQLILYTLKIIFVKDSTEGVKKTPAETPAVQEDTESHETQEDREETAVH